MNILIVDDEIEIREGLSVMLKSSRVQFNHIYTAVDGVEALDRLTSTFIDIVISDIRMPRMGGLDLTEQIRNRFPDVKVIILSGFSEFGFVQQAVRLGATDFLLKPIGMEELNSCFRRVIKQMMQSHRINVFWSLDKFSTHTANFKLLIACDIDDVNPERALQFGDSKTVSWLFHKVVHEVIEELETGLCVLQDSDKLETSNLMIGVYGDTREHVDTLARQLVHKINHFWEKSIRLSASFGICQLAIKEENNIKAALNQACLSLFRRIFERSGIYHTSQLAQRLHTKISTDHLLASMEMGNLSGVFSELETLLNQLILYKNSQVLFQGTEVILMMLYKKTQESNYGSEVNRVTDLAQFMSKLMWSKNEGQYIREIMTWVGNLLASANPEKQGGQILQRAKEFIRDNLHLSLTLTEVGHAIYVSPGYLSRIFRERSGETFLEYTTNLRMEKAKQLLIVPGIKIYEVAEKVGYGSWKQFSRTFKELTGYTPADYRKEVTH